MDLTTFLELGEEYSKKPPPVPTAILISDVLLVDIYEYLRSRDARIDKLEDMLSYDQDGE